MAGVASIPLSTNDGITTVAKRGTYSVVGWLRLPYFPFLFASSASSGPPGPNVIGWAISPTQPVTITYLGFLAPYVGTTTVRSFAEAHSVGLYDNSTQTLLASVTTKADNTDLCPSVIIPQFGVDPADGYGCRSVPISPVVLQPGRTYTVAGTVSVDGWWNSARGVALLDFASLWV